jgi:hypothetical protein
MAYFTTEVDVYPSEFFHEMDDSEREEMLELLLEWQNKQNGKNPQSEPRGLFYLEFSEAIDKIKSNYLTLTNEETELIISISKNF